MISLEEWIERIKLTKKPIEMIEFGGTCRSKSKFKCLVKSCNNIWQTSLYNIFIKKSGCPVCANNVKITKEEWIKRLEHRPFEMIIFGGNNRNRSMFQCSLKDCLYIWKASLDSVFRMNTGCPKCAKFVLTPEEKARSKANIILRKRLRNLRKRNPNTYTELERYVATQLDKYPKVPKGKGNEFHTDHIIPLSFFNPFDIQEMKYAWSYKNMQILPAKDNLSKGSKILEKYLDPWHYAVLELTSYKRISSTNTEKSKVSLGIAA